MISGVRLTGPVAAVTYDGPVDSDVFLTYVRDFLVPQLRRGDVVVMDNLSSHKVPGVAEAIQAAHATLLYLPPYSPDYNPTENLWSKVKTFLRRTAARCLETLGQAVTAAFNTVTPEDCRGFFAGCGYVAT
jgi:transposase